MTRDNIMKTLMETWKSEEIMKINGEVWLSNSNALSGNDDILVSTRLKSLVGEEFTSFRKVLMALKPPATLKDLLATITRPEGVTKNEKAKDLGYLDDKGLELLDGKGSDMDKD